MSLEVIYVTRHGFRSSWSVDHVTGTYTAYLRSPTGLPTDPVLTSHGVEQASELGEHLMGVDPPIDRVYSSPYYRCLQTISPFVSRRNNNAVCSSSPSDDGNRMKIRVESGLSEWYGRAHFEHPTSAPLSDLDTMFADLDMDYVSSPGPQRLGESIPQLYERVASCIQAIIARCDEEGKKAVVVCTHAAVVIALGRILTGQVPEDPTIEDFGAFTCGLSTYRRLRGRGDGVATKGANYAVAPGGLQNGELPPPPPAQPTPRKPVTQGFEHPSQTYDVKITSRWTCETNSDCSFLRGGEERGWKFSGDESFVEVDQYIPTPESQSTAAVVEKEPYGTGTGTPKL
ncbi:phosphoglycerate mutase-like protein [Poronia punctata]|nr:phosphoglycerate mutase-like protein [Poronia punctata]